MGKNGGSGGRMRKEIIASIIKSKEV